MKRRNAPAASMDGLDATSPLTLSELRAPVAESEGRAEPRSSSARIALLVAILVSAVLLPPLTARGFKPEVRPEQVLALVAGAWLVRDWWRAGRPLRPMPIDWLFVALGLSVSASILYAPVALGSDLSARDGYEVLKLGLYWVLFRFAWVTGNETGARAAGSALRVLLAGGALAGTFALMQYYDWFGLNGWATPRWAPDHHLRTLAEDARTVGTLGNANYHGMLSALVLLAAISWLSLPRSGRCGLVSTWVAAAGAAGGAIGLVTSASRGATVAFIAALIVVAAASRRTGGSTSRRLLVVTGGAGLALLAVVVLVQTAPRGREDYLTRMAHAFGADPEGSLRLRLESWRSAGLPWRRDAREADAVAPAPVGQVAVTGVPSAGEAAAVRDRQRKLDLATIGDALDRYRAGQGSLPSDLQALVPEYLAALPSDPEGRAYDYQPRRDGYTLAARLEDPADPDFPLYARGSGGSYLHNGSLEAGGMRAEAFQVIPGTRYQVIEGEGLFGARAALFAGNPENPGGRAALYQQRYLGRSNSGPLTAAVWVKLLPSAAGDLSLYTNLYYADGTRADPHSRVAVDGTRPGVWQRVTAPVTPDPSRRITYAGVYLMAEGFTGEALLDGFELVDGTLPLSFPLLRESAGDGGSGTGARLRESPLLGVGPRKAEGVTPVDNEYLTIASRYGLVGLALYLALWSGVFLAAWRRLRHPAPPSALALRATVAAGVIGLLLFNVVAGSLLHLQLMGIFWPLAGVALGASSRARVGE